MAEAWVWYRAMLRSSRMVGRHAGLVERRYGAKMHELAAKRILRWAADPRVDAAMLRRALDDALAADRLTAPISDALKLEYLIDASGIERTELPFPRGSVAWAGTVECLIESCPRGRCGRGSQQFRFRATNDTERSRRVIRFLFTNWLAQVDKPAAERAPSTKDRGNLSLRVSTDLLPREARDISPETIESSDRRDAAGAVDVCARTSDSPISMNSAFCAWEGDGFFARERKRRSVLIVKLAAELYRREQREARGDCRRALGGKGCLRGISPPKAGLIDFVVRPVRACWCRPAEGFSARIDSKRSRGG